MTTAFRGKDSMTVARYGAAAIVFASVSAFWVLVALHGLLGSDALVYRAGAEALLSGADPWSAGHNGWTFAAPPLEALAFIPTVLIPPAVLAPLSVALAGAGAALIVRRLGLQSIWLAFPPLVMGVMLGNPAVIGMALLVAGFPLVGVILRPQLILVARPRAFLLFGVLSLSALALRPDYVVALRDVVSTYAAQSGTPVNFWGSPLMLPALGALGLLWTVDRRAAAWLAMPAVGPAMGWYGYMMVMPVRSLALGLACAVPIHGLGAAAITVYAVWRFGQAIWSNRSISSQATAYARLRTSRWSA